MTTRRALPPRRRERPTAGPPRRPPSSRRRRPTARPAASAASDGPVQRVDLGGEVAGAVPGQPDDRGRAPGRPDPVRQGLERGLRTAVAGDEEDGPEHVLGGPGVGVDVRSPRIDDAHGDHDDGHEHTAATMRRSSRRRGLTVPASIHVLV